MRMDEGMKTFGAAKEIYHATSKKLIVKREPYVGAVMQGIMHDLKALGIDLYNTVKLDVVEFECFTYACSLIRGTY